MIIPPPVDRVDPYEEPVCSRKEPNLCDADALGGLAVPVGEVFPPDTTPFLLRPLTS